MSAILVNYHSLIKCFMSVKCYDFIKSITIDHSEHNAEIIAAKEYFEKTKKIPRVIVHVYNRFNKQVTEYDLEEYLITGLQEKAHKILV